MESFSWADSLRALIAPCLNCLRSSKSERNDLEDLLADSGSGTTADAETLSMHSNPGAQRRKRTRFGKTIRLFGWDLFGRQPIRLPEDEDEAEADEDQVGQGRRRRRRRRRNRPPPSEAISSTTLDSDAAPLDSAAIESQATRRAEEEAEHAARRARRRERKEAKKRAALALEMERAAALHGDGEFEGFPGSGGVRPPPGSTASTARQDDEDEDEDEDEEEDGDFGADAYTRRPSGSSDSGRGSDSISRTSSSVSGQPYNHHYISQQPAAHPSASATAPTAPLRHTKDKPSRSSASKTSSSKRSRSSPSASQSPSIASPVAPQFSDALVAAPHPSAVPHTAQEFDGGFPNGPRSHTVDAERLSSGFPSPGIGGPRNGKRDYLGAFLANRGDA